MNEFNDDIMNIKNKIEFVYTMLDELDSLGEDDFLMFDTFITAMVKRLSELIDSKFIVAKVN